MNKKLNLEFSRTIDFDHVEVEARPDFDDDPTIRFESFYEVNFSMEPVVKIKKDVWMV